ncbi:hypothetical protein LUZ60_003416 [Juncus effusus]|nr:hypothetical protein LUZ60_003416 [Juncus effusus]
MVMSSSSCSSSPANLPMFGGGGGGGGQMGQRCKLKSGSMARMVRLLLCNHKSAAGIRPGQKNQQIRLVTTALCCCLFALSLSFLVFCAATRSHLSSSSPSPSPSPLPGKGYTVLINTWKRNDLLKRTVLHYASCNGVDSIHVVWSERNPPQDSLKQTLKQAVAKSTKREIVIIFDLNSEDSLNNRFKEKNELKTDAVFSIDDDVICPCSAMEFGYTVWNNAQKSMVGFVPRMHWKEGEEYKYGGWWSVWWSGTYSMVLSKAAFFDKMYLELYTHQMLPSIRDYVANNRNCEDIAMSFLVANVTGSPPIWVQGKIDEIGSTGISSLGGHSARRSKCVNDFAKLYGTMPLLPTNVKAVDSRTTWLW